MEKTALSEIILDTRRVKKNGLYPLKVRITYKRKTRYYSLNYDITQGNYDRLIAGKRLSPELQSIHSKIYKEFGIIREILDNMKEFSFEAFNNIYLRNEVRSDNVEECFLKCISAKRALKRVGTAESYGQALSSLIQFHKGTNGLTKLTFSIITPHWLHKYETKMISEGKSLATVGVYLRSLRSVFNTAIEDGIISKDIYPFGKRKYVIPSTSKRKKALSDKELSTLFHYSNTTPFQDKARDFWFLSFYCNGANLYDILSLKWGSIEDEHIYFIRKKTENTTRTKQVEIIVPVNSFISGVIAKYGLKGSKNDYVFPVLRGISEPDEIKNAVKNFTRYLNQHIKALAKKADVNSNISTVWARHSFTTSVIRMGGSMEFVQESLGHQNIQTTMNYWAGFDTNYKKEISEGLLNLVNG